MNRISTLALASLAALTIGITACSDDSSSAPAASGTEFNSETSSVNDTTDEDITKIAQPITLDMANNQLLLPFPYSDTGCIMRETSVAWEIVNDTIDMLLDYSIENGILSFDDEDLSFGPFWNDSNTTIIGNWYLLDSITGLPITNSGEFIRVTSDSLSQFQKTDDGESAPATVAVEDSIDLRNSYFMYDTYTCIGRASCNFSHWHFSKPSENLTFERDYSIAIQNESSHTITFTYSGQEFTVTVEHVQDDSLNNGYSYYSAYIANGQNSCHYEYTNAPVAQEQCIDANLEYFLSYTVDDAKTGSTYEYMYRIVKDNETEFSECVVSLVK